MSSVWHQQRILDLLGTGKWFRDLAPELQRDIAAASDIRIMRRGTALCRAGEAMQGIYAALEGDIRVFSEGPNREKTFLRPMVPGSWFGSIYLMAGEPRSPYELWCNTQAVALFLSRERFEAITAASPDNYRAFARMSFAQATWATRIMGEHRADAPIRTARALIRLANVYGQAKEDMVELGITLSQSDLASMVGVSRQYLNELLHEWMKLGVIEWKTKGRHRISVDALAAQLAPGDRWILDTPIWC